MDTMDNLNRGALIRWSRLVRIGSDTRQEAGCWILTAAVLVAGCSDSSSEPENQQPRVTDIADTLVARHQQLVIPVSGNDPEGQELKWRLVVNLSWEEVRSGYRPDTGLDGVFRFRPGSQDGSGRHFEIWASDPSGQSDSTAFFVEVR